MHRGKEQFTIDIKVQRPTTDFTVISKHLTEQTTSWRHDFNKTIFDSIIPIQHTLKQFLIVTTFT